MARSALEQAGIACALADENINAVYPLYGQLSGGIKLMVREADFEAAREVLIKLLSKDERDDAGSDPTHCPECDSSNIVRRKFFGWILLAVLLGVEAAWMLFPRRWKCKDCGNCWRG
jgi:hypothetical protein